MGRLSPLDGIGPKEIRLDRLLKRATDGVVREVILATNFTNEGEATAHYIGELLRARGLDGQPARARRAGRRRARIRRRRHARAGAARAAAGRTMTASRARGAIDTLSARTALRNRCDFRRYSAGVDFAAQRRIVAPRAARRNRDRRADKSRDPVPRRDDAHSRRKHDTQTQSPALPKPAAAASRRKFLKAAGGAAAGAATLGFPMIAKGADRPDRRCAGSPPGRRRTSSTSTRSTTPRRSTT